jgi:hypothetical protein
MMSIMNTIKNVVYGVIGAAVALAPAAASAQWTRGKENAASGGVPDGTIIGIISGTMNWLLAILGFLGIIGFVIAGILYLTAAGDEDQATRAKSAMTYSIIGIAVALMGFVVILAIESWLSGDSNF